MKPPRVTTVYDCVEATWGKFGFSQNGLMRIISCSLRVLPSAPCLIRKGPRYRHRLDLSIYLLRATPFNCGRCCQVMIPESPKWMLVSLIDWTGSIWGIGLNSIYFVNKTSIMNGWIACIWLIGNPRKSCQSWSIDRWTYVIRIYEFWEIAKVLIY